MKHWGETNFLEIRFIFYMFLIIIMIFYFVCSNEIYRLRRCVDSNINMIESQKPKKTWTFSPLNKITTTKKTQNILFSINNEMKNKKKKVVNRARTRVCAVA
jgi:hypothetical protein